jgi:hypothetical protein
MFSYSKFIYLSSLLTQIHSQERVFERSGTRDYLFDKHLSQMMQGTGRRDLSPDNLQPRNFLDLLIKQGVCHTVALPFTHKRILRQKKNYGKSNISPCNNIIFKKSSKRSQNPSRYYNSVTDLKLQHKPKISKILTQK